MHKDNNLSRLFLHYLPMGVDAGGAAAVFEGPVPCSIGADSLDAELADRGVDAEVATDVGSVAVSRCAEVEIASGGAGGRAVLTEERSGGVGVLAGRVDIHGIGIVLVFHVADQHARSFWRARDGTAEGGGGRVSTVGKVERVHVTVIHNVDLVARLPRCADVAAALGVGDTRGRLFISAVTRGDGDGR